MRERKEKDMSRRLLLGIVVVIGVVCFSFAGSRDELVGLLGLVDLPAAAQAGELDAARPVAKSGDGAGVASQTSRGLAALDQAGKSGRYLFVFFHGEENDQTRSMRELFDRTMSGLHKRAESVAVDVRDPAERPMIEKFRASRTPLPLALAIAPNGAVTGGFPLEFTEEQLMGAFVSTGTEDCLAALQQGRFALVCVQGATTQLNAEALKGVKDFAADVKYAKLTDIVIIDPADSDERALLEQLSVDPETPTAVTVLMVPPANAVTKLVGKTDKAELIKAVGAATAGSGCGVKSSAGCCPKK
jgi:hypothetical protein